MTNSDSDQPSSKRGRKPKSDGDGPIRRTVNLSLTDVAWLRGSTHAAAQGTTVSALVNDFLLSLPEYVPVKPQPSKE